MLRESLPGFSARSADARPPNLPKVSFAQRVERSLRAPCQRGTYSFTTPIYYVNAAPHLGTAYTTIAADTVARYQRMNGYDVAFVTGMDEHGQKVADTAETKGMTPQDWCDSMEPAFRDAWDMLGITYTDFVRTTKPRHTRTVQKFWNDLYEKGYLYKGSYEGWYCVHEETYYAKSDLEKNKRTGSCPRLQASCSADGLR